MRVCTPSHVYDWVYVFKPNELSSRYSRFPTSRLEIRDFAGTIFARLHSRRGKLRKGIENYVTVVLGRISRGPFYLTSLAQAETYFEWKVFECGKFDDKTSLLSLSLLSRCKNDGAGRHAGCEPAAKVLSLLRSSKRLALMLAFLIFIDPFLLFTRMNLTHRALFALCGNITTFI